ncbi:hypothetical protein [Neobacillus cucumis]|nr:hypothetical protein [Neobacillus cucumis]MBM7651350.1 hypothetical protein [Neobacillus cucumis]
MNSKSLLIERIYSSELTQRATLVAFYLINGLIVKVPAYLGLKQ